jgi:hypothetical protein
MGRILRNAYIKGTGEEKQSIKGGRKANGEIGEKSDNLVSSANGGEFQEQSDYWSPMWPIERNLGKDY